jgi:hypothetical protein
MLILLFFRELHDIAIFLVRATIVLSSALRKDNFNAQIRIRSYNLDITKRDK